MYPTTSIKGIYHYNFLKSIFFSNSMQKTVMSEGIDMKRIIMPERMTIEEIKERVEKLTDDLKQFNEEMKASDRLFEQLFHEAEIEYTP